ncbi:MAG: LCP family protein [Bacilli bacterium]|nr:LCP family protein [Bacilli bacterium]
MKSKKLLIIPLTLFISILLFLFISQLNLLPNKYYFLIFVIIMLLNILSITLLVVKNKIINIIGIILNILVIIISLIGIRYIKMTINYLDRGFNNREKISAYNVIVLKQDNYDEIQDLDGKKLGYIKNELEKNNYLGELKINCQRIEYDSINTIYDDLLKKKIDSIIIDEVYLDLLEESDNDLFNNIKIIYSFDVKEKVEKSENITKLDCINVLISGSDSRTTNIPDKSRSDVNMIMTINPSTKTILLTSIPRDYYVRLHGTSGYKDKLTHAGIYGIDMTKNTVEDLFDINIDYTVKVGFQSVIKLVDLVGGVDINSDKAFYSHCGDGGAKRVYVKQGMNHFSGAEALSYARERYAYTEGDRHRILNQQQVLEAVMVKIFKDRGILFKYDEFLGAFSNLYITDIPISYIKLFVKKQLDDMGTWNVIKQSVDGFGQMGQTYSMPGMNLYVMEPNQNSIDVARKKINEVHG